MPSVDSEAALIVYDPAAAAERLEVSASGLRRLAPIYESVFGELKRVGKGDEDKRAREWSGEAIDRLQVARALTGRGRPYRTIESALEAIRDGLVTDSVEIDSGGRQSAIDPAIAEALQVLLVEVRALRAEVVELKQGQQLEPLVRAENSQEESVIVGFARRLDKLLKRFFRA